jgi:hypothetical protein
MDDFDKPYWNINQVLLWVYHRDRSVVRRAFGSRRRSSSEGSDKSLNITSSEMNRDHDPDGYYDAKSEVLNALVEGKISASAIREGANAITGNVGRTTFAAQDWLDLELYFDSNDNVHIQSTDVGVIGSPHYKSVKISRVEIMAVWPDPQENVEVRNATVEPPESLATSDLEMWLHHDSWTALEAVFLLHGKKPRTVPNDHAELRVHFQKAHIFLGRALDHRMIGKRIERPEGSVWVDSPANWYAWAKGKPLPLDFRVRRFFDPESLQDVGDEGLSRNEKLQRDANALAAQWKIEKRPFTKENISRELTISDDWKGMDPITINTILRKQW